MEDLTDSKNSNSQDTTRSGGNFEDGGNGNTSAKSTVRAEKPRQKSFWMRFLSVFLHIILVILLIPPSLAFLFRSPEVQTLTARLATFILSDYLDVQVKIDAIKLDLRSGITIKNLSVKDQKGQPMIAIGELHAKPVLTDFLVFSKLELDGAVFRYARYKGDEEFNLKMLINRFNPPDTLASPGTFKLRARKLILKNSRFHFYDETRELSDSIGMDYDNIIFDSINLVAAHFQIINDSINFKIEDMSSRERSGFLISNMSTDFIISQTGLHAKGLVMDMDSSHLNLDLDFNYHSWKSYADFIDSVEIVAEIRPSAIMMSDISYFNEIMNTMPNKIGVTGKIRGTISNMKGEDIKAHYEKNTRLVFNGRIKGLPDFYTSYIRADIKQLTTSTCELKKFGLPVENGSIDLTSYLDCNDIVKGSLRFKGYYNNFDADLALRSREGDLKAEVQYFDTDDSLHFNVSLQGDRIHLGRLMNEQDLLGNAKVDVHLLGVGHDFNDMRIESSGTLYSFDFGGYRYSRLRFFGQYVNDSVWGNLVVGDKNLMLKTNVFALIKKDPRIKLSADLRQANLDDLNLGIKRDFGVSAGINIDIRGIDPDRMTGSLKLSNAVLTFGKEIYREGDVSVVKAIDPRGIHSLQLNSDMVDLNLTGKYRISTLFQQVEGLLDHYFIIIPEDTTGMPPAGEYAIADIHLKKDNLIADQFVPGLHISDAEPFRMDFNFDENSVSSEINIRNIDFKGIEFRNNTFNINTANGRFILQYANQTTVLHDSTADNKQVFGMDSLSVKLDAGADSLDFGLFWNNDTLPKNSCDLKGYYALKNEKSVFRISNMELIINDTIWRIDQDNRIVIDTSGINIENWEIMGGTSRISVMGKYLQRDGDTLKIDFHHWNLSNFDMLTKLWGFDVDGIIEGNMEFSKIKNNTAFISDLMIDSLALNHEFLGDARFLNTWDNELQSIKIASSVVRKGSSGKGKIVSINGNYFPFRTENVFDLNMSFSRFKLKAIESFFTGLVSDVEGVASGELKLKGSPDKPVLTGYVDTHRSAMRIDYLNTKYSFSNVINFEPEGIDFGKLIIYDTLGNSAKVTGHLQYEYFKNPRFDVTINTDKLLFFNTDRKMNDLYYGTALTSGIIHLSGKPNDLHLDMDVQTQPGTHVFLPLDYSVEISDKDYIVFVQHTDSLDVGEMEKEKKKEETKQKYNIRLNMTITPEAKMSIFLPSDVGRIESQGNGNILLKANSDGDFKIVGDYIVEDGMFNFSLANLVQKRFDLVRGGRISWTGDPYDADINIKGLYKVKASLQSLGIVVDSTTSFRNKVNVDCYVIMKNKLLNPDIRFEILMPDLDPDLKRIVYSELDTTNQAMMNEQMISLLILGTFSYSNASNISLSSSYYAVLSNQLSSILSKISDEVDIGVNYKPGDAVSQEEFEVALSTQFLNDRLTVEGHFGMTYDRSNQNASNFVGDIDLSYALTEDGRWILKAFNHSNVTSWYNAYDKVSPYTQGAGIAYRKDFNNIAEFFRRTRPKSKKKKNTKK